MVHGMKGYISYLENELKLPRQDLDWSSLYTFPPGIGKGTVEVHDQEGISQVWISKGFMTLPLVMEYMQGEEEYISISYREDTGLDYLKSVVLPDKEHIVKGFLPKNTSIDGCVVVLYRAFFDRHMQDSNFFFDCIQGIQAYEDKDLMKRLNPILTQMLHCRLQAMPRKLFIESRLLEIAAVLLDICTKENTTEKIRLSDYDEKQLRLIPGLLEEKIQTPPGISELARMVALNEYKLKVGFRQIFGMPVYEYLRRMRMEKAISYLEDGGLSVAGIGRILGYKSVHGFSGAFQKYYGRKPSEWRRG